MRVSNPTLHTTHYQWEDILVRGQKYRSNKHTQYAHCDVYMQMHSNKEVCTAICKCAEQIETVRGNPETCTAIRCVWQYADVQSN